MQVKYIHLFLLLFLLLSYCKEKPHKRRPSNDEILVQEGFIVKTQVDETHQSDWYFVSAKNINKKKWIKDFRTDNLRKGFWFFPMGHTKFPVSFIEKHLDTLHLPNITGKRFYTSLLMLFPVKIKYKLKPEFRNKQTTNEFIKTTREQEVRFGFNNLPVNIQDVIPLVRPRRIITECQCKPRADDVNGYLFKICIYMKKQGVKYSDDPCNYSVRKMEADTLNGKKVVRVDLNCCYLGDRAYFDPITKELLVIKYGAM